MKEKPNNRLEIKKSLLLKPLGGATKQNFYKFQNFQKFDNFLLLSNNSYLSYPSNSKNELSFKNDSEKILQLFKKNVASYLILKRHFDGKKNFSKILHDFKLRNQVKVLNISETSSASLRKNDSFHYDIKNPLKNYTKELDESKMQPILTNEPPLYIKIDCQLKCEQAEIPSFPFKLNLNSLQKKFIQKHAAFLNNEKIASELLISRLVDQLNIVLSEIQEKKYGLNLPKYLKPMMEDFNDFYREKRKGEDEEELKKDENESSNAMALKIDIEDIFIDQILNNMESSLVEEKKEEEISKKGEEKEEEEENEENDEEENKEHQKSHKILKKMEKYLRKKPPPTQNQQNGHNASAGNQQIERNNDHAEHEQIDQNLQNNIVQDEEESRKEEKHEEVQNSMQEDLNNNLEENKSNNINLLDENQLVPPPQRDGSRMDLINKLLESNDLYNEDLSVLKKGLVYPQPPADIKFVNDIEKDIFNKIFHWLYEIEIQVEKDKRDIEYYEKEYQLKFKDHYQKYQEMDEDDSIFDAESLEEVDEEESDMSYEDESNEEENEKEKNE